MAAGGHALRRARRALRTLPTEELRRAYHGPPGSFIPTSTLAPRRPRPCAPSTTHGRSSAIPTAGGATTPRSGWPRASFDWPCPPTVPARDDDDVELRRAPAGPVAAPIGRHRGRPGHHLRRHRLRRARPTGKRRSTQSTIPTPSTVSSAPALGQATARSREPSTGDGDSGSASLVGKCILKLLGYDAIVVCNQSGAQLVVAEVATTTDCPAGTTVYQLEGRSQLVCLSSTVSRQARGRRPFTPAPARPPARPGR